MIKPTPYQVENLEKLKQFLIDNELPEFSIDSDTKCALAQCKTLFPEAFEKHHKKLGAMAIDLFGITWTDIFSVFCFNDLPNVDVKYHRYKKLPSDKELVIKNIDTLIKDGPNP